MNAEDVRTLAGSVPERWESLHLRHRGTLGEIEAWLRHGELDGVTGDGSTIRERGATPSSWTVRPLEPIWQSYLWAAMLDPYELTSGVTIDDVRRDEVAGRPAVAFRARALPGYDPICSCCPLVFSEVSQKLEFGTDWLPAEGETVPEACDLALDLATGIVVSSRTVGGTDLIAFENEILAATLT
jgi:hypothetical protein